EVEAGQAQRLVAEPQELDEGLQFILACNRPTILPSGGFERLSDIGRQRFQDAAEVEHPLLLPTEVQRLSIARGSLSADERLEIESHVTHTFRFLSQIPWTRALRRGPRVTPAPHQRPHRPGYPPPQPA